jgi:hypothetical protein
MRCVGNGAGHALRPVSICTDEFSQNSTSIVSKILVQYSLTKCVSPLKGPCSGGRLNNVYKGRYCSEKTGLFRLNAKCWSLVNTNVHHKRAGVFYATFSLHAVAVV